MNNTFDVPGYEDLGHALSMAYDQSARGKGKQRHANARPFTKQPIMEIARMVGVAYQTGQIQKKAQEATSMANRGEWDAAMAEMLGVIVYGAAAYLRLAEMEEEYQQYRSATSEDFFSNFAAKLADDVAEDLGLEEEIAERGGIFKGGTVANEIKVMVETPGEAVMPKDRVVGKVPELGMGYEGPEPSVIHETDMSGDRVGAAVVGGEKGDPRIDVINSYTGRRVTEERETTREEAAEHTEQFLARFTSEKHQKWKISTVKLLLAFFGVSKVTNLDADDINPFLDKLDNLETLYDA
jgi:hypothetical protein